MEDQTKLFSSEEVWNNDFFSVSDLSSNSLTGSIFVWIIFWVVNGTSFMSMSGFVLISKILIFFDNFRYLSTNGLIGSIPLEIFNLVNLDTLYERQSSHFSLFDNQQFIVTLISRYLSENFLSGSIPPEIGNLSKIRDMFGFHYFCWSKREKKNIWSKRMTKWFLFHSRRFSYNPLGGSIPPSIGKLTTLQFLYEKRFYSDSTEFEWWKMRIYCWFII